MSSSWRRRGRSSGSNSIRVVEVGCCTSSRGSSSGRMRSICTGRMSSSSSSGRRRSSRSRSNRGSSNSSSSSKETQ